MKKKIIGLFIFIVLIGTVLTVSGNIGLESNLSLQLFGKTLYVGGSGPGNYSSIQEAIDNASDGDTVFVFDESSPYNESITINTSIKRIHVYSINASKYIVRSSLSG